MLDANPGKILAIVSRMSFNINNVNNILKYVTKNRAITDVFERGFTIKYMIIITVLKIGIVKKNNILSSDWYK
ncbi:penicillin-binding transpeptidase domain-containing protein [Pantoea sp. Mhis]|uniref:penicillin-binding transpeptidase domain-containing protein n=1 Tax=Pantoea sp. Mhis TaxID=2576759 RepID=UPI0013581E3F